MRSITVDGIAWTEELPDEWWSSERGAVVFGAFALDGAWSGSNWVDAWFYFADRDGEGPGVGPFDDAVAAMRAAAGDQVDTQGRAT